MSENVLDTEMLSTEQRRAIEALAAGATKEMAAAAANRTRRTLDRWIAEEPAFTAALRAATDEAVQDAARRLSGLLGAAITAVENDLKSGEMDPADNRRTLDTLAKHAVSLRGVTEWEERLRMVEDELSNI